MNCARRPEGELIKQAGEVLPAARAMGRSLYSEFLEVFPGLGTEPVGVWEHYVMIASIWAAMYSLDREKIDGGEKLRLGVIIAESQTLRDKGWISDLEDLGSFVRKVARDALEGMASHGGGQEAGELLSGLIGAWLGFRVCTTEQAGQVVQKLERRLGSAVVDTFLAWFND